MDLRGPYGVCHIELKPSPEPKAVKPYRCVGIRAAAFKALIEKFRDRGMLRAAQEDNPEWVSRAFVVPKPGGKWRLVIDYRHLNSQIKDLQFPLPNIEDRLVDEGKNVLWTIFDLEDGFHQMPLTEESKKLTAFMTPWGVFEWEVLPMGLKTAPAAYQRMVQYCLSQDPDIQGKPYIDDMLEGTPGNATGEIDESVIEAHYQQLRKVFACLQKYKLTVKREKCHMFMTRVKFCGHILEAGTRRAAPSKTEPIVRWSTEHMRTPTHMKAFLGLTQWYAIYMPNYAHWAAILSESLTGMECNVKQSKRQIHHRRIKWTDEMIEAFERIKELMRNSVMLQIPDVTKPFLIRTDASQYAVGASLEQEDDQGNFRPVAFFSRKLQGKDNLGQRAWSTREKETYALIGALHKFRSWIHSTVLVRSLVDHQALISWFREDLGTISGPVGRRGRWHEFLSQFNIQVEYTPGKGHIVPDTLSRWAYPACEHAGDATMHGSVPDREGVHRDESESRKWEDKVISERIFRLLGEERAALASVRQLRASWDNEQMEHSGIALKEDNQFSARLAGMLSIPEKVSRNHIKRVQCVVKRMQSQCWGYESAFLPAHISGISDRTRSRSGQSHESIPAQHHVDQDLGRDSVAGGHLNLAAVPSASDDAHDPPGSEQFLPSPQGDTSVLFSDWTEEYKADPELKELFEYLQKGNVRSGFGLHRNKIRCKGKILVPPSLVDKVVLAMHAYSHPGADKLKELCMRKFAFPDNIGPRVQSLIQGCATCQTCKARNHPSPDTLDHFPIPDYPFASLAMDFVKLPHTKVGATEFDFIFVIVDRLTGYTMGIPCLEEGLTAEKAAELFLDRCVFFTGLPTEIMSDNDKVVSKQFFETLCALSGVEQHKGVIYRPHSNGRAEVAVKLVVNSLRRYLAERKCNWVHALPLALWCLNDLPGVVSPYSPHRLVFGRDPIGFGDCPPHELEYGQEDALQFFDRVSKERQLVQTRLTKIHADARKKWMAKHPPLSLSVGDRVWVRYLPTDKVTKIQRLWFGPCEVIEVLSEARYLIATPKGEQVLPATRLKPYIAPFGGQKVPFHYYVEGGKPPVDDSYVLEDILDCKWSGSGRNRKRLWHAKWRGHEQATWEPIDKFIGGVNNVWARYNKASGVNISVNDLVRVLKRTDGDMELRRNAMDQLLNLQVQ